MSDHSEYSDPVNPGSYEAFLQSLAEVSEHPQTHHLDSNRSIRLPSGTAEALEKLRVRAPWLRDMTVSAYVQRAVRATLMADAKALLEGNHFEVKSILDRERELQAESVAKELAATLKSLDRLKDLNVVMLLSKEEQFQWIWKLEEMRDGDHPMLANEATSVLRVWQGANLYTPS